MNTRPGQPTLTHHSPPADGDAQKTARMLLFCGFGAQEFSATKTDLSASRAVLSGEGPNRLIDRVIDELGLESGHSSLPQLTPAAIRLLEAARTLDDYLEFAPYAEASIMSLLADPEQSIGPDATRLLSLVRQRGVHGDILLKRISQLPVYRSAEKRVLQTLREPDPSFEALAACASSDQVLAGAILSHAQRVEYMGSKSVRGISQAMMRMGSVRAATVMIDALFKPIFQSMGKFRDLWRHSLEAAQLSSVLAADLQVASVKDAYVLGLVHDVGSLLLQLAPPAAVAFLEKLEAAGCAPMISECLAFGMNHAEAGRHVLLAWGFEEEVAEAVRFHHEPELSPTPLASLMYLVEQWSAVPEDLPSCSRVDLALRALGTTAGQFEEAAKSASMKALALAG